MKNVLIICTMLIGSSLFAQGPVISNEWKVKGFGISFGYDMDMMKKMDYNYFLSTVHRSEDPSIYSNMRLERDYVSNMICENPHFRANVTLLPPKLKNTEINLALVGIFNRIDMVSYKNPGLDYSDPEFQSMDFTSYSSEIALESTLLRRIPLFGKVFNLYAGLGTNIGVSFGGELSISGYRVALNNEDVIGINDGNESPQYTFVSDYYDSCYRTKSSLSQRVFGNLGLSALIFQRFELGIEYRQGIGYRYTPEAPLMMTHLHSGGVSARWKFR